MTKDVRIKKEVARLNKIYKDISKNEKSVIESLIRRASFMSVTLEDMEADLDANGFVELFSQSEKAEPYERERPTARLYNTINKNYQCIIKQLSEFVEKAPPKKDNDGFDDFIKERPE